MKSRIHRYKKLTLFVLFLFFAEIVGAQDSNQLNLFNELSAAYNSGFYPGAVSYADRLVQNYPQSVFIGKALTYEGESLFRLGRTDEAGSVLLRAEGLNSDDSYFLCASRFWSGRVMYEKKDFSEACKKFYTTCETAKSVTGGEIYYAPAVLYAGRSYYELRSYEQASACFEYVITHGKLYERTDYEKSAVQLFFALNSDGNYEETSALFKKFRTDDFQPAVYNVLSLYAGDAYEALGLHRAAYDLYCSVLTSGSPELSVKALRRAYAVSAANQTEVGEEPGSVLAKVQAKLSAYPQLVAEFWTRLGIDAYKSGLYEKAVSYFDLSDKDAERSVKQTNALYRTNILLKEKKGSVADVASYLSKSAIDTKLIPSDKMFPAYMALSAECAGLQGQWQECISYSNRIETPDVSARYWYALAEYNIGNYGSSVDILEKAGNIKNLSPLLRVLYARALAKDGRLPQSVSVFSDLSEAGLLDNDSELDYAKALLLSGKLQESYDQAMACSLSESDYVAGLASFNAHEWARAEKLFSQYMNGKSSVRSAEYFAFSLFYCGYAQYRQGKFADAAKNLVSFSKSNPNHILAWNAHFMAANATVQTGNFDTAASEATLAINTASSEESVEKSVLLSAGIYTDSGQYDKALSVLAPYTALDTDFGLNSRYQKAQVLLKQSNMQAADKEYADIASAFPNNPLAEESQYRRGELYYGKGDYRTAVRRFTSYLREYPDGRFSDSALYFSADSLNHEGFVNRAILQYSALLKSFPDSTYAYSTMKNLIGLYEGEGDYGSALKVAQKMTDIYGAQAKADNIDKKIAELTELNSGTDLKIVKQKTAYSDAGGSSSPAGRKAGTLLAQLYASSVSTQKDAAVLAEKLLELQKKNIPLESADAAQNAMLLGKWYRTGGENKKSADMYLLAAQYYRMNNDAEKAAGALYSAVDAFDAAKMYADSEDTAKTLTSLYPKSREAEAAKAIIAR